MVKSRNPLFPDLEISERHIDWNFGWFEISEKRQKWQRFRELCFDWSIVGLLLQGQCTKYSCIGGRVRSRKSQEYTNSY